MRLLTLLLRQSNGLLLWSIVAGAIAGLGSAAVMALANESISRMGSPVQGAGLAFLVMVLLVVGAELVSRLLLLRLSTRAVRDMRVTLCEQILRSPLRRVEEKGSSGLMGALTEDIGRITEALVALPAQCVNVAIAVACFGYLFWLSWPLAAGFVGIFAIGILVHELFTRAARPWMLKGRNHWDDLIGHYSGIIDGNKELKLHRRRRKAFRTEELHPTADAMMAIGWRSNSLVAVGTAHSQLVFFALLGLVLYLAPGFAQFEREVLTGFVLMALFMSAPIAAIVGYSPKFHMADVCLGKIHSLGLTLSDDPSIDIDDAAVRDEAPLPPFRSLELRGVEYLYQVPDAGDRAFLLGPVDLAFRPGELVFVIGGNGSGKSSFIRILTGLYAPTAGTVLLDGAAIDDANRDDYRQHFSSVFSDYHLFRTLYGLSGEDFAAQAAEYLARLELDSKVSLTAGRLSTVDLSQGQRKRLALLTSFLENRQVYVFDEWAADQDPAFKRVFYQQILPGLKARGKSIIVVSHDDQYFEAADRVVRFADGRVVEDRYLRPVAGASAAGTPVDAAAVLA